MKTIGDCELSSFHPHSQNPPLFEVNVTCFYKYVFQVEIIFYKKKKSDHVDISLTARTILIDLRKSKLGKEDKKGVNKKNENKKSNTNCIYRVFKRRLKNDNKKEDDKNNTVIIQIL